MTSILLLLLLEMKMIGVTASSLYVVFLIALLVIPVVTILIHCRCGQND